MLGLRGVRLGIHMPELVTMQVRALFEAACDCVKDGVKVQPKVMIPLVAHRNELQVEQTMLVAVAKEVMAERQAKVRYQFGTMIEIPRAALTADQIAGAGAVLQLRHQRPDPDHLRHLARRRRDGLPHRVPAEGHPGGEPLRHHRRARGGPADGHGGEAGPQDQPEAWPIGICGEHGGDPKSIAFCHRIGLDSVSCSPFRVPVARLAAAHAALSSRKK